MESDLRPLSLAPAIWEQVRCHQDRHAVMLDDRQAAYGELWDRSETRAQQMLSLGISSGDRVGILLPNCLEYLEIILGAAIAGAVAVPINMRFKSRELRHLIADSGLKLLYTQDGVENVVNFSSLLVEAFPELCANLDPVRLSLGEAPALTNIVALHGAASFMLSEGDIPIHSGEMPDPPAPEHPLLLMYTSGTTANPKGCIVSHRAFLSNAWSIVEAFELTEDDIWWCPLPMFHIGGLLFVVTMLAIGGGYGGMSHFEPEKAIDMLKKAPPTIFYPLFPTITLPIIRHPRFAEVDQSRMRILCNLAPSDLQQVIQAAVPNAPLVGAFGMTETCGTVCYGLPSDPQQARFQTCGRPLPGWKVKIVNPETREPCRSGERGEIAVKGNGLFSGYWNEPELTAALHLADDYFLTGDVGSLDEDGYLSFHGRFKDQLKVGGENVAALEVESFLATHPAVALAQVVGIDDEKYGEVPAAFIELRESATASEEEIIAFCTGKIARFKVPRYVRFVTEWPMSATKIVKFRLRDQLQKELFSS